MAWALAVVVGTLAPSARSQDRPPSEKPPAGPIETADAALRRAQELAEGFLKTLRDQADRVGREGDDARERLSRQLEQARAEAQRAAREAREQLEQALEKAKDSSPEKEQAIRKQLRDLEARLQDLLGGPRPEGVDPRDPARSLERLRDQEARLRDEIGDLERRLEERRTQLRDTQRVIRDFGSRRAERPRDGGEDVDRSGRRVAPPPGSGVGPEIEDRFRRLEDMLERLMKRIEGADTPRRPTPEPSPGR
jgi:DNA repair exonuclease SbcCD ATPase subunit